MVTALELRGNDITDAWLAVPAIELDAHFVTFDRGFQRFPDLHLTVLGWQPQRWGMPRGRPRGIPRLRRG